MYSQTILYMYIYIYRLFEFEVIDSCLELLPATKFHRFNIAC